jgi:predicted sugar kinase
LLEQDLDTFGRSIAELQRAVGDHFAPAQGGRFSSPHVAQALNWLEAQGIACVGQSSWGPTGFAIVASEDQARSLAQAIEGADVFFGLSVKGAVSQAMAARRLDGLTGGLNIPGFP